MRHLILKIPSGNKNEVFKIVEEFKGKNTIHLRSDGHDVFHVFLPNKKVNNFLKSMDELGEIEVNLSPRGIISLYPPASGAPDQVADVQSKSSFEIYLGGIQSVGSMFGLIGYSLVAGIIVWIGLFTTTSYLLVAAMLVAPFAGPAMNAALATASGKRDLLFSSLKRYFLAIFTGVAASFLMTFIFPLSTLTPLMEEVSQVSKFAIFLPLVSGFAGAINICQSERDSLVSGAAVGILVAASLAPPVGLIGMGLFMMDWQVVASSVFRIVLQLLGIHLAATLVFYFYGKVTPNGIRFLKGKKITGIITTAVVLAGIGAMMFWQFSQPPFLRKASMNTELTEVMDKELQKLETIQVIGKNVIFTNRKRNGKPVVIFEATVLPTEADFDVDDLEAEVIQHLKNNMKIEMNNLYKVYKVEFVKY